MIIFITTLVTFSTFCDCGLKSHVLPSCEQLNFKSFNIFFMHLIILFLILGLRKLFSSFSIRINFRRVFQEHQTHELDFIYSIKFLTMLLVILGHCILLHSVLPFANPEFIEDVSLTRHLQHNK